MPYSAAPITVPKELLAPKNEAYYDNATCDNEAGFAEVSSHGHGHHGYGNSNGNYGSVSPSGIHGMSSSSARRFLPERSDQYSYAATVTAEMTCRCPHIDAYLPHYLDSGGLGLLHTGATAGCETLTHPLKHHSKRQKRMTISDVHLASILPLHKKKVGGAYGGNGGGNVNVNVNVGQQGTGTGTAGKNALAKNSSQYTFGEEEKKTDAIMMGGVAEFYAPIHAPTFVGQVEKEREFEMQLLNHQLQQQQQHNQQQREKDAKSADVGKISLQNVLENESKHIASSPSPLPSMSTTTSTAPISASVVSDQLELPTTSISNPDAETIQKKIVEYRSTLFHKSSKTPTRRKGGRKLSHDSSIGGSPDAKPNASNASLSLSPVPSMSTNFHPSPNGAESGGHDNDELLEQVRQREEDVNAALSRVEHWLEVIRLNRMQYWRQRQQDKKKASLLENADDLSSCVAAEDSLASEAFQCMPCWKKSERKNKKGKLFSSTRLPRGDALMQCLDCSTILCGSGDLCGGIKHQCKRHMQQHFLLSNHSLAITCGSQGKIFCMRCGDYVYNEVFQREIERVGIEMNIPWFAWDRHETLKRSFGFSHREEEDFVLIPEILDEEGNSQDHAEKTATRGATASSGRNGMVVWRGFKATYPNPVPDEIVVAAQKTLRRLRLFRGEAPAGGDYFKLRHDLAEMALNQNLRYPQKYWSINCPVGIYNAGNICYISSVLQCIFNLRPVQKYFLRDVKHDHKACAILRSSMIEKGLDPPCCLACEMDKLMLTYYASTTGIDVSPLLDKGMNPSIPSTLDSSNHGLLGHESDVNASSSHSQQGMPIVLSDFLVAAWQSNDMLHLAGNEQHDAHEFMQAFLDIIDKDCKRFHNIISEATKPQRGKLINSTISDTNDPTRVLGNLRSVLMCGECGYKRSHLEPFLNVSLSLPTAKAPGGSRAGNRRQSSRIDVRSCIDLFSDAEPLSDDFFCTWCKKKTKTHKQHTFAKLPTILCLHLKRFCAATNKKIDDQVIYPSTLDMGPYLPHWREIEQTKVMTTPVGKTASHKSKKNKMKKEDGTVYPTMLYDLCGTINHSGTLNQGHYIANVKVDKDWYSCNDTEVNRFLKEAAEKELNRSEEVYMLFYKRRF